MHDTQLIATIAIGLGLAFVFGYAAARLRFPPLVGYLVAGVFAGPFTPGLHADAAMAGQLAEVGVILLMFGVGLHFSIADLLAVRAIAVPGAVIQIVLATGLAMGLAHAFGWSLGAGLVFGLSLSVASTVVLLKALEDGNRLDSAPGRVAVGWLIVEDLAMVLALVLLPAFATMLGGHGSSLDASHGDPASGSLGLDLAFTFAKVAAFVILAVALGPKIVPWVLGQVARTGSRELFTLSVLAIALGIAFGSAQLFGVSFALGAFFAGVILSESDFSHRAAEESLPLQDAFSVLFFVSVGMLFDPSVLVREPVAVVATLLVVIAGKAFIAFAIVLLLRYPLTMAVSIAASLAQIGEFSFILVALGLSLGLLPPEARDLVLAAAILSIMLNKAAMQAADRLIAFFDGRAAGPAWGEARLSRLEANLAANRLRAEERDRVRALDLEALLATFPALGDMHRRDSDELLMLFQPKLVGPGARVIRRGDRPDGMYFIASGRVEVETPGGTVFLGPGGIFGEMALLDGSRRRANVTAVDYCRLLVLAKPDFDLFMARHPEVEAMVRDMADQRLAMNERHITAAAS